MEKTNLELFREALNEAWDNKIRREVESCTEEIITSERHKAAMQAILNGTYEKPAVWRLTKTKIAAILAAALLLLASCAVVYRNEIRDFVEEIYDKYIEVTFSDETTTGKTIEEVYHLDYVPDGYIIKETNINPTLVRYEFADSNNNKLVFEQRPLDTAIFSFDIENGYDLLLINDNTDIYYKNAIEAHYYLWNDGIYSFKLRSETSISTEELSQIIDGTKLK